MLVVSFGGYGYLVGDFNPSEKYEFVSGIMKFSISADPGRRKGERARE